MKFLPHGTTIMVNSVLVGGLISVSIPDRTRGEAEVTDTDSAFDREFIPGLRDGGSVNLSFRFDPEDTGQVELVTNFNASGTAAIVPVIIEIPAAAISGGQTFTFDGFVTAAPSGDLALVDDSAAEQTATIRVAGPVAIA
jgi:hypothetical protein